mmetsp:Transcript_49502/g.117827  ORF Transcript_49502/g.117827 Transcript_49502/m.117827 type:complete len:371 (+) Transcript_49502:109-1221(+)
MIPPRRVARLPFCSRMLLLWLLQLLVLANAHRPPDHSPGVEQLALLMRDTDADTEAAGAREEQSGHEAAVKKPSSRQGRLSHTEGTQRQQTDCKECREPASSLVQVWNAAVAWKSTIARHASAGRASAMLHLVTHSPVPSAFWYLLVLFIILYLVWINAHRCISAALQHLIEEHDQEFVGLEITIGTLVIWPVSGYLLVKDMTIANPEGYKASELAHVEKIFVRFNTWKFLTSVGTELFIDALDVLSVRLTVEKTISTSNAEDLLQYLKVNSLEASPDERDDEHDVQLHLRKVQVDMEVTVSTRQLGKSAGATLPVSTLHFDDFEQEVGGGPAHKVGHLLLERVLKFALASSKEQLKTRAKAQQAPSAQV